MSVQITIPDRLYESLKRHAIPFVDTTPVEVIERWARYFDERVKIPPPTAAPSPANLQPNDGPAEFDPIHPPSLFHTRARGAFGPVSFSNWNDLLRIAHVETFKKAQSFDVLRTATHAQIRKGNYSENGYRYLPEIDISLQGVDANHAWLYALRLAQYLQVPVWAAIDWRNNEKAAYPERAVPCAGAPDQQSSRPQMSSKKPEPAYKVLPLAVVQRDGKKLLTSQQLHEGIAVVRRLRAYPSIPDLSIERCGDGFELRIETPTINPQGWLRAIFWVHEKRRTIYIVDLFWKKTSKVRVADLHRANQRIRQLKAQLA